MGVLDKLLFWRDDKVADSDHVDSDYEVAGCFTLPEAEAPPHSADADRNDPVEAD